MVIYRAFNFIKMHLKLCSAGLPTVSLGVVFFFFFFFSPKVEPIVLSLSFKASIKIMYRKVYIQVLLLKFGKFSTVDDFTL